MQWWSSKKCCYINAKNHGSYSWWEWGYTGESVKYYIVTFGSEKNCESSLILFLPSVLCILNTYFNNVLLLLDFSCAYFPSVMFLKIFFQDFSLAARRLAMDVIGQCAGNLEPCIKQFLVSSLSGDSTCLNNSVDYHEVIYDVYQCAPQILYGIVPYITGELLVSTPCCWLLSFSTSLA